MPNRFNSSGFTETLAIAQSSNGMGSKTLGLVLRRHNQTSPAMVALKTNAIGDNQELAWGTKKNDTGRSLPTNHPPTLLGQSGGCITLAGTGSLNATRAPRIHPTQHVRPQVPGELPMTFFGYFLKLPHSRGKKMSKSFLEHITFFQAGNLFLVQIIC